MVIIARNNSTTYPELAKTVETVERTDAKIIGVILNRVKPQETRKSKGYYSRYGGYYSSQPKTKLYTSVQFYFTGKLIGYDKNLRRRKR